MGTKLKKIREVITKISPVISSKLRYYYIFHEKLNIKKPKTFNEKINWLKINRYPYDNTVIQCTDKYLVREYLKNQGYDQYNVKILGAWDSTEKIEWDKLPQQFVLKCNHGSQYNIICKDKSKIDQNECMKKLKKWLKEDFGLISGELHYSKISRKIICEEYLGDDLVDFQVWCSYGKILFESYIKSPHGENCKMSFDTEWNKMDFVTSLPQLTEIPSKPIKLKEIKEISQKISKDFPFLRLDFYILNDGNIKISELTFSPSSGFVKWNPKEYNECIGELINIKEEEQK